MTEKKKNPIGAIVFMLFIIILPIATVLFSKFGLDRYKDFRSEMRFLKDSIRVDFDDSRPLDGATLNNPYIKGKLVMAGYHRPSCTENLQGLVEGMKKVQGHLSTDDQKKILFVLHLGAALSDSLAMAYRNEWKLDSSQWKLLSNGTMQRYGAEGEVPCSTIALLDGRVSRKDKSDNYLQGPLLGDYYDLNNQDEVGALLRHMAVLMPAKTRKSIEYRAEEKLYHSNQDSTNNE